MIYQYNKRIFPVLFAFAILLLACQSNSPPVPDANSAKPTLLNSHTQFDFAAEWKTIASHPDQEERFYKSLRLKKRWEGKVYQWFGYVLPELCFAERNECFVHVFEKNQTPDDSPLGGVMPSLQLTRDGYQGLLTGCRSKKACIVHFQGLLKEVRTHPEMPLGFSFVNVEVQHARESYAQEQWWSRPVSLSEDAPRRTPRADPLDQAVPLDLSRLQRKSFDSF